ncbi:MAG: ParB/RepB/Spo0J family partition protein [Candidatus Nomurabacteria bacterium]|jgi:ParB family chromosome partitioning protein|nr:ParB/RepB/Spo0J family partition protein [Candidatus Nomurabacteria bacterium]
MSIKKGLGRSFESLIPTELIDETFDPTTKQDQQVSKLVELSLKSITPDESQPRRHFDEQALDELAASIKEFGVLQPIVVTKHGNGEYMIVAGERRWRASKMAGQTKIPAIVRTMSDQNRLESSLIENVQRKDLNVLEIATAYAKLRDQFDLTVDEISRRVAGRSASSISNMIRLLKLPANVKQAIVEGQLTEGQARPLIGVDAKVIDEVLPRIIFENWSARKIEQFVVGLKSNVIAEKALTKNPDPHSDEVKKFEKSLGLQVGIHTSSRGSGKIVIKFKNAKEFEKLSDKLLS